MAEHDWRLWARVFRVKALYNWGTPLVGPALIRPGGDLPYFYCILALVCCFGIGYWAVPCDMDTNRGVVIAAVPAQAVCGALFVAFNVADPLSLSSGPLLPSGLVDLAVAGLFALFRRRCARPSAPAEDA